MQWGIGVTRASSSEFLMLPWIINQILLEFIVNWLDYIKIYRLSITLVIVNVISLLSGPCMKAVESLIANICYIHRIYISLIYNDS